ncbi:low-density lipoprotein receptor-related protein 1B-like isoform X2 [Cyprinus carpio]|uniref:Low-density lipoprotein receptor-related protein 1B-like isoform X2 n=1 Tax=Cyprinus carpio TaxID=7962 RepID=A0A9Q9XZ34_CYPCA|nr:low-density lipoprotein receptor-related protein 1B-like isoform X2 [Cyprinus carpio]
MSPATVQTAESQPAVSCVTDTVITAEPATSTPRTGLPFCQCSANWSGTQCERPASKTNRSENVSGRSIAIIVPLVLLVCIITAVAVGLLICKRCRRGKQVQRQPMANGGLNVEIGNPSYNMYEVDHDNHVDVGSFLHPSFTLDPHKGWCVKSSDPRNLPPARPLTAHTLPIQNLPKELIPGQAMKYSNPIYSKMTYHDRRQCRKPVINLDMRTRFTPKEAGKDDDSRNGGVT